MVICMVERTTWKARFLTVSVYAFPAYAVTSTLWSLDPRASLGSSLVLSAVTATFLLVWRLSRKTIGTLSAGIWLTLLAANLSVTVYSLCTLARSGSGRTFSTMYDHPTRAGTVAGLFLLLAVAAYLWRPGTVMALLAGSLTLANAYLVSLSGTRLGLLAIVSGLAMLFAIQRGRLLIKVSFVLAAAIGVLIGSSLLPSTHTDQELLGSVLNMKANSERGQDDLLRDLTSSSSGSLLSRLSGDPWNDFSSGRVEIWKLKIQGIHESPAFGIGFDASQSRGELMAHSQLLTITEELGLVGLGLFLMWIVVILGPCWKVLNKNPLTLVLVGSGVMLSGDSFLFGWRNPASMLTWVGAFLASMYALRLAGELRHGESEAPRFNVTSF